LSLLVILNLNLKLRTLTELITVLARETATTNVRGPDAS
jgi:hypothetical protein